MAASSAPQPEPMLPSTGKRLSRCDQGSGPWDGKNSPDDPGRPSQSYVSPKVEGQRNNSIEWVCYPAAGSEIQGLHAKATQRPVCKGKLSNSKEQSPPKEPAEATTPAEPFDTTTYQNLHHRDWQPARQWKPGSYNHMELDSANIWMSLQKEMQPAGLF